MVPLVLWLVTAFCVDPVSSVSWETKEVFTEMQQAQESIYAGNPECTYALYKATLEPVANQGTTTPEGDGTPDQIIPQ